MTTPRKIDGDSTSIQGVPPTQWLMEGQFETSQPIVDGLESVTDPLIPDRVITTKLGAFDADIYDMEPGSHLRNLLDTVLGPAGIGGVRKQVLAARMANGALNGTVSFDLDAFWGSLFGLTRVQNEQYQSVDSLDGDFDPTTHTATLDAWDAVRAADGSFRSRILRVARGFALGATEVGIRTVAEAVLDCPVHIQESWRTADLLQGAFDADSLNGNTWGEVEDLYLTWADVEQTWKELTGGIEITGQAPASNRGEILIRPLQPVTEAQRRQALRVLDALKPVGTFLTILAADADPYGEILPRSVSADSEDWRVSSTVAATSNSAALINPYFPSVDGEITKPADGVHDGEMLIGNGMIRSVTAYAILDRVIQQFEPGWDVITRVDGSVRAFPPSGALKSASAIQANRAVSDGVLSAFPFSSRSPSTVPVLASDMSDLSALSRLNEQIQLNGDYWATAPRYQDSPLSDVLEIHFSIPQSINQISFQVSKYPHVIRWEWQDADLIWHPVFGINGEQAVFTSVPTSKPRVVPNDNGSGHPQHDLPGHWLTVTRSVTPVNANAIRFTLNRDNKHLGRPPVSVNHTELPYSLAIRKLQFTYLITRIADIPATRPATPTTAQPFASSTDAFDSTIDHALHLNSAALAIDPDPSLVWECEPQPRPDAVVSIYADLRTPDGGPCYLDSIYLDPTNVGSHLTVYSSEDDISGTFSATAVLMGTEDAQPLNGAIRDPDTGLDLTMPGAGVEINNRVIGLDESHDWWMGLRFIAPFSIGDTVAARTLYASSQLQVSLTSQGLIAKTSWGAYVEVPIDFYAVYPISLIVSVTGATLRLSVDTHGQQNVAQIDLSTSFFTRLDDTLRLGIGTDGQDALGAVVTDMVIRQETLDGDDFLVYPEAYTTVPLRLDLQADTNRNTLLRLDWDNEQLVGDSFSTGLFSSVVNRYGDVRWTPVPRDYQAVKGWLELPRLRARLLKLEFTRLPVRPREVYQPVERTVRYFPANVIAQYAAQLQYDDRTDEMAVAAQIGEIFPDRPSDPALVQTKGYSATQVLVIDDDDISARFERQTPNQWGYRNWHSPDQAPRWVETGPHRYRTEMSTSTSRIGYGVGLRSLKFALRDPSVPVDVLRYDELIDDAPSTVDWIYDERDRTLTSGSASHAVVESDTYVSISDLVGLQYSTVQSDSQQLLPDPDFRDPDLINWMTIGDVRSPQADAVRQLSGVGSTLFLDRGGLNANWLDVETTYLQWQDFEGDAVDPEATFGQLDSNPIESTAVGGVGTVTPVPQPFGGRMYAAARVYADKTLTQPLALQIVDSVTDDVLAEKQVTPQRNQITEWFVGLDAGAGGDAELMLWGDLTHEFDTVSAEYSDDFNRSNANRLGQMSINGAWDPEQDTVRIQTQKAAVTVAGQVSRFLPPTPWGTWTITLGATPTSTDAVPLLDFGAFWVHYTGTLRDLGVNRAVPMTYTPTAGDVVEVTTLLTSQLNPSEVPSGVDASVHPFAIRIEVNGTLLKVVCTGSAPVARRGLMGLVGQRFDDMRWTPSANSIPSIGAPQLVFLDDTEGTVSLDNSRIYRFGNVVWTKTSGVLFGNDALTGLPIATTTAPDATEAEKVLVDCNQNHGSLRWSITSSATGSTRALAVLDVDRTEDNTGGLVLRADGSLVRANGTAVASGNPLGLGTACEVVFTDGQSLSAALRTSLTIPDAAEQVVLVMQGEQVKTSAWGSDLWQNTTRGVATWDGDVLRGMSWSPSGAGIVGDVTNVTWDLVTREDSVLWGEAENRIEDNLNPVHVRLQQTGTSRDHWFVDNISMFVDPIQWEFSRDGGVSWVPGHEVRNDSRGVVLFPDVFSDYDLSRVAKNELRWRLTGWGADAWVSHLAVRPWYANSIRGATNTANTIPVGSQLVPTDHLPPIEDDPDYGVWHEAIPRWWWFAYKDISVDAVTDAVTLGDLVDQEIS